MADSGDEQVTNQHATEASEDVIDSVSADLEKEHAEDESSEDGLVEEVMKAISASSSPQPGELPEADSKQPESEPVDSSEAQESSEGAADNIEGEVQPAPAGPPTEPEPPAPLQEEKGDADEPAEEKEVESAAKKEGEEERVMKEEEQQQEASKPEGGEGEQVKEEEGEPAKEQEPEEEQEKSRGDEHEAGPHWLSAEEVRAKGLAEECLNKYRKFHLKQAFSVNKWYELLKECTFDTELVALSEEQVEAVLASHHLTNPTISEEHKEALSALEEKLNEAIAKFGEDGAFVKLNTQGVKDVVLDQCDPDHITSMKDDIVTEVEVDRQTSNAYLIWRSWRSASFRRSATSTGLIVPTEQPRENVIRRSFRRIQRTWHQNRAASSPSTTAKSAATDEAGKEPLAEDTVQSQAQEDQSKPSQVEGEQVQSSSPSSAEKAEDKEGAADAGVQVTAEVTVEAGATSVEATEEGQDGTDTAGQPPPEEEAAKPKDEGTEASAITSQEDGGEKEGDEPNATEQPSSSAPAVAAAEEEPKESTTKTQSDKPHTEGSPKGKKEPQEPQAKTEHVHSWGDQAMTHLKEEPMNNRVLRAFKRVVAVRLRVTSGSQAVNRLLRSAKIHQLLTEWKEFSAAEGGTLYVVLRRWNIQIPRYPDMMFRAFVFKNKLTALTQHDQTCFTPNIARFKSTIEKKIKLNFADKVQGPLGDYENYTVDFFVSPNKVLVVDIGPFQSGEHSGLFCWISHHKQLTSTPIQFKVISNARKGDIFTDLSPTWKEVCQSVTEQKVGVDTRNRKCVIL